ncbi:MAG: anthranilate synthase component I family protein [Pirellulaceae bacterium]
MSSHQIPYVLEISAPADTAAVFRQLVKHPKCVFFDSSLRHHQLGRYSFLSCDPLVWYVADTDAEARRAWHDLQAMWSELQADNVPGLPPFQGGIAGLFGYELGRLFERIPMAAHDELRVPLCAVGLYDVIVAFDHDTSQAWIISQGWPETSAAARFERAVERAEQFSRWLAAPVGSPDSLPSMTAGKSLRIAPIESPHFLVQPARNTYSNFTADGYRQAVRRAIEYIRAGDVFQVNLSQRLMRPATIDTHLLYLQMRQRTQATFGGYLDAGSFQLASLSPERFISVRDRVVEARPIKGTRQRMSRAEADLYAADELQSSAKDRSENVMIVDLLRNDLSRVCIADSVMVQQLCGLETYGYVQHLVSSVRGRLRPECTPWQVMEAAFPGGSVTGAPKVRAMEVISQLEQVARGAYCGSLGYIGTDGSADMSILIRTLTAKDGWWHFPVGGGIVADSDPQHEYEETWHKATGILQGIDGNR